LAEEDPMPKLRVHNFTISLDGYAAGPNQRLDKPLGDIDGPGLHEWMFATRMGHEMLGKEGGGVGLDNDFALQGDVNVGATIMGRNMFGPIRGTWDDDEWTGWWGENPPYHHPVFVLTHHPRPSIPMQGGTTFHFVDDGIESALTQAVAVADGKDVRIGGGASTIQQYLRAGLIDEMHVVVAPMLIGAGERLFDHLEGGPVGYECTELVCSPTVAHARFSRAS
jgi:dihydrofolate reductase